MALGTFSKFYYGYEIGLTNNRFDFDEGIGELNATIPIGIYTPTDLAIELKTQLDAVGTKTYTVTFNRSNRVFTIACDAGTFDILIDTGAGTAVGVYELIGFTGSVDLTGLGSYVADSASGYEYRPQFWLQDYTAPGDFLEKIEASVNQSADGQVEVISFGDVQFIEFTINFITDLVMDGKVIRSNQSGVQDARDFLAFCIKRGAIEFMPDASIVNTFYEIILETTPESSKGVSFKLKEETSKNLPGIYQSGRLKWRIQA